MVLIVALPVSNRATITENTCSYTLWFSMFVSMSWRYVTSSCDRMTNEFKGNLYVFCTTVADQQRHSPFVGC